MCDRRITVKVLQVFLHVRHNTVDGVNALLNESYASDFSIILAAGGTMSNQCVE